MNNISNTLCWAWHFLLLVESNELSLQLFANKKKKKKERYLGQGWFILFYQFLPDIFCGSCWSEPLALLLCCSIFLFVLHDHDSCLYKSTFSSYLTCMVNNIQTPGNKCLVQMKFAARLLLRKRAQWWWKGINFKIWTNICRKSFFFSLPFPSQLEQSKWVLHGIKWDTLFCRVSCTLQRSNYHRVGFVVKPLHQAWGKMPSQRASWINS